MRMTREDLRTLIREMCGDGHAPVTTLTRTPEEGRPMGHGGAARMTKRSLQNVASLTQSLHDRLEDADELPEWVQAKVAAMLDDAHEVADYLGYEMRRHDGDG